jgi:peptide/nickel transport system substrate-binding protein
LVAFSYEPAVLEPSMGSGSGNRDIAALLSGFLAYLTPDQQPVPYLAEELPSFEKGTWRVTPDGRAETTYRLKKNAAFHDGTPITAQDFVFAYQLHVDPALPMTKVDVDRRMAAVRALDEQTLFIEWKEPYLWAGTIYGPNFSPLPRHLLEEPYLADKAAFANGLHWSREYVSSGPFKLERWEQGVEMTLRAHEGFALGRPQLDTIVLRFIPDANAIVANLLSGTIDAAWHSSISYAHNRALEQAGWQGTTEYWPGSAHYLEFQTKDWGNLQKAVLDGRVRRALIHAVDRRAIVEDLYAGKADVYYYWLSDDDPSYAAVDRAVPKHAYDPARALSLLAEAGWTRGGDGQLRNAGGENLQIPLVSQNEDMDQQQANIVADNWKTLGFAPEVRVMTTGQQRDNEFRAKIAAVAYNNRPLGYDTMVWTSGQIPTAENRWRGNNYASYVNPALDELWPRVLSTYDAREREVVLIEALTVLATDAVINPLHSRPRAMAYRDGVTGPKLPWIGEAALTWNAWEFRWKAGTGR